MDDGKIKVFADFCLASMDHNDFGRRVSSVVEKFPVADCDSAYRRSFSLFHEVHTPLFNQVFYIKVYSQGKTIYPLYSKVNFRLMAVRSGDKVLVLESEEEFVEMADHFAKKELVKVENIKYFKMNFDSDSVVYGFKELVESVEILSRLDVEADSYELMQACNRLYGFAFSFAMKDWSTFCACIFKYKTRRGQGTTDRMKAVRDNWLTISQYVYTRGKKVSKIRFVRLDLPKVKNILYVFHFKEGSKDEKLQMREGLPEPPKVNLYLIF
ncbi:hypothetical protein POM88_051285 [Heracleum sosnowskyi]|uniref:Uncharacterized protein n=1 Tax=Heracleum sosnowskyi TaxID=360622 RepID=A0AAD8H057_9APIA|nr:hypothetical protein POM88_051285 [Heracleum sosnowskyi]